MQHTHTCRASIMGGHPSAFKTALNCEKENKVFCFQASALTTDP